MTSVCILLRTLEWRFLEVLFARHHAVSSSMSHKASKSIPHTAGEGARFPLQSRGRRGSSCQVFCPSTVMTSL